MSAISVGLYIFSVPSLMGKEMSVRSVGSIFSMEKRFGRKLL